MKHSITKSISIGLLLLTTGIGVAAAGSTEAVIERQRAVQVDDLNLDHPAGVETLYQRIRMAARGVCGSKDIRNRLDLQDWKRCHAEAVEQAVEQTEVPALTALHEGRAVAEMAGLGNY